MCVITHQGALYADTKRIALGSVRSQKMHLDQKLQMEMQS